MKKNYIYLLLFLSYLCSLLPARGADLNQRQDSLIQLLAKTSDTHPRLELLRQLSFLCQDDHTGPDWMHQLIKEARKAGINEKEDWAIRSLTRYYHNDGNLDSVIYYAGKSDSLAKTTGIYSDYYYDSQSFLCQFYLWNEQLEKAADNAIMLYNRAKENNNQNGIICGCETLGLIYQRMDQDSTAVNFFIEGLNYLKENLMNNVLWYNF